MVLYLLANQCLINSLNTVQMLFYDKLQEMPLLYALCVCGAASACVYVLVFILVILHKVIINVIQTNLLGGF